MTMALIHSHCHPMVRIKTLLIVLAMTSRIYCDYNLNQSLSRVYTQTCRGIVCHVTFANDIRIFYMA